MEATYAIFDRLTDECIGDVTSAFASSGHACRIGLGSFVPIGDLSRCSNVSRQSCGYSITSSASNWIEFGTSMPSALAVCRLMTNSNLVVCNTGRSAGFAPLRMLPV